LKDFLKQNGILILIAAVLLAAIAFVISLFFGGTANPVSNVLGVITTPVRDGINAFANWTGEVYTNIFETESLREENERLKKENARLQEEAREGQAASRENERLRNLLDLRAKRRDFEWESATVTARSAANWESTLTISKGSNMGIEAGDCVVDDYGNLVGVVGEVGLNYAVVVTLIDSSTNMGGLLERTDGAAILEGDFALMGEGKLKLTYLPENTELMAGDTVLTSGKGGMYPSGLVVGHIEEVHTDASGMSRYAVVVPETDLSQVKQVVVIKDFDIVE